jgi:hypothetical protein
VQARDIDKRDQPIKEEQKARDCAKRQICRRLSFGALVLEY